ncbi:MAG TPA: hypothetical protein VF589_08700 [Allosphingosinicella sp.]
MDAKIDMGRVVSRGFQVIGRHALPFIGLALLLGVLPTFLTYRFLIGNLEIGAAMFLSPFYWLSTLISLICTYLLQATLVRSSILELSGRGPDVGGSLAMAVKLLLPMIGIAILTTMIVGIGMMLLVVPGIIAYIMLIVAVPVLVEERNGVIGSMQRSRALTKGSRWRILVLLLLFGIIYFAVSMLATFALGAIGIGSALDAMAVVQSLTGGIVALIVGAMLASLYVELRTVKEGATPDGLADIFA